MTHDLSHIRNFSIIAHIDHGKSTLADRLLQATKAVSDREAREQLLDSMDLERERGITIKASAVTVAHEHNGVPYMLNFIDTPGHVDFGYEVSRALKACEGALLVVDASQGVEAQTVVNAYLAVNQDLEIIPVLNKIDLPGARPDEIAMEVEQVLGFAAEDCIRVSAKTGEGIPELLAAICERLPSPKPPKIQQTRALIFDAVYDDYRGVVLYCRMFDGRLKVGDKIRMMAMERVFVITELGKYTPKQVKVSDVGPGETCYLVAAIKTLGDVRVGDTITLENNPAAHALEGYEPARQMVYCDFYPATTTEKKGSDFEEMRDAIEKLSLNDASFTSQAVHSEALGFGFRCGFLGLLHMDIIQERLEREFDLELVQTAPTVSYQIVVRGKGGEMIDREVHNPADLPDMGTVLEIREPICKVEIMLPKEYIGDVMKLCLDRRGIYKSQLYVSETREILTFEIPLAELIYDFYDKLKGMTSGYGTMDYEVFEFRTDKLVKVDILINGDPVEALSLITHKEKAEQRGRLLLTKLRKQIDRHQFEIPLQAAIGGKVIARETIKAFRKDVTAKCYGGDVTRKRKLLEKQKKGKDRMKSIGSVNIPQEAFMAVLDVGE
ncbi:MAG: translation elongation factor 4 [Phycisphaeraceae bacterium]|nr:translation elongation factor 4 [Phycisphaeraceae bacterium]MCW5763118.1 translation elongation factor 4 [Phycisphaeraceae bacterium]